MSTDNGFVTVYTIRLPDGQFLRNPFSGSNLVTFSDFLHADSVLDGLKAQAAAMGITDYRGEIVRAYRTPFIGVNDNASHMIDQLSAWLAKQTGGGA